jgi:hypothetical protein
MSKNKQQKADTAAAKSSAGKVSARPVARKTVNALARERRANPAVEDVIKSWAFRQSVIARANDSNPETKRLREKFIREDQTQRKASELFDTYRAAATTERELNNLWAQAVQAVKTDKVGEFSNRWGEKTRAVKNATKA